jgi:D-psicose/D-tagatose/L-ribulose 3-epimerase
MKFGMNLLLWSTHITEDQFHLFDTMKNAGYDGVEIPCFEGDVKHFTKIGKALKKLKLGATSVTVMTPEANCISPDKKVREAALDRFKWALDCSAAMGSEMICGPMHQTLGVFSGDPPTKDERKRAVEVHRKAAEYAKSVGVKIALEYLNRFECYFLTTMADAAEYVRQVGHPWLGTMYDTFHANIEEKDGPGQLRAAKKEVFHIHISENDRGVPGTGHVPWIETFRAINEINYDGWLTIEAFGRALPALAAATKVWRDFFAKKEDVYEKGIAFMKSMVALTKG